MKRKAIIAIAATLYAVSATASLAGSEHHAVDDETIAGQRAALAAATDGVGFGPQSPRDIDAAHGLNTRAFGAAPGHEEMHLCNIHFHENAEHKGGDFTTYAGNGNGHGYGSGYKYDGELTNAELAPLDMVVGESEHGALEPGDTIEIHFVHSSALVEPGPTLGACVSEAIKNPHLRVETVVAVLVNDPDAESFLHMAHLRQVDGFWQANPPADLGTPVEYAGSTTGPGYNEKGSPFLVTWNVRPNVAKLDINTVAAWLDDNPFDEDHAHGVRNLVTNPELLSPIN